MESHTYDDLLAMKFPTRLNIGFITILQLVMISSYLNYSASYLFPGLLLI